jgi:glycosyltransferase involved in cell wall biosynthesis
MKISVVIATYRRADSLGCTLASIVAQERRPDEVIIVDQSPVKDREGLVNAIGKAADAGLLVQVIWMDKPSLTKARNLGLAAATGSWVIFSDDDVNWPSGVLSRLAAKIEAQQSVVMLAARDTQIATHRVGFLRRILAAFFLTNTILPLSRGKVFACMQARYPQPIQGDMETEWGMGYWFAVDRRFVSRHGLVFDEKMTRYALAEDMLFTHQLYRLARSEGRRCIVSEDIAVAHLVSQEWREPDSFADLCGAWNRIYIAAVFRKGPAFWFSLFAICWAAIHQALVRMARGRPWLGHLRAHALALRHLGRIREGRFDELYAAYEKPSVR